MWHQHEYPSPQHNPWLPDKPIRTLQHRERMLWRNPGKEASVSRRVEVWPGTLDPVLGAAPTSSPVLLVEKPKKLSWHRQSYMKWKAANPSWLQCPGSLLRAAPGPDISKLMDCHYMVSCMEISQPTYLGCFLFFFFAWVFVREMLKSWLYLKIIVQFSSVEKEPGFYLKNYIDATTRKQA